MPETAVPFSERVVTARLYLMRLCAADLADLRRMHRDPGVMATLGGLRSDEETRAFLRRQVEHWERHSFGLWTARVRGAAGAFAGRGGLRRVTIGSRDEVEVAYAFMPDFWGRGLATELAVASVRAGLDVLGLAELVCFTQPANRASRRVMEKAGFRYERDVEHMGLAHVLYRLRAAEWALHSS
jgi:RimJ/RimL family protein N-acetyltransferase